MLKSFFQRPTLCTFSVVNLIQFRSFVRKAKRSTGRGKNTHISNRSKLGLFHGKDVRSGHSISFSHKRSKRKWYPNVINKRVWSDALDDWVRFKMTTTALKQIDRIGGIDNYIMSLDEKSVQYSNYIQKIRTKIGVKQQQNGTLPEKMYKRIFDPTTGNPRFHVIE